MSRLGPFEENTIVVGDCLKILSQMPKGCVDLVVTDPPYGIGRYHLTYDALLRRMIECARVLNDGTVYVLLDSTWAHKMVADLGSYLPFVGEIIWKVGWVSGFKSLIRKRWILNHNFILQFGKAELVETLYREPKHKKRRGGNPTKPVPLDTTWDDCPSILHQSFSREKVGHPEQKPEILFERLVKASSNPGDLIFDPFIGSGTTAVVADRLGRKFFGCDINPDYVEMALKRLEKDRAERK